MPDPRPLSDDRLAVLRAEVTRPSKYALEHDAKDMACELLAEVERLRALLGAPELQHRLICADDTPHAPTDFDLAHPDWWMPGVRHEVRDVYPTPWRPADQPSTPNGA